MPLMWGFPDGSDNKESACSAGDLGLIPEWGRFPREGNGNSFRYSCLENSMEKRAWGAIVYEVSKSRTQLKQLNTTHIVYFKWIYLIKESNVLIFDS